MFQKRLKSTSGKCITVAVVSFLEVSSINHDISDIIFYHKRNGNIQRKLLKRLLFHAKYALIVNLPL